MRNPNFLIGRGELLTYDIKGPKRKPGKAEPYSLSEAKDLLTPQILATVRQLDLLPQLACPHDLAVVQLTLNPSFIAKSFFPSELLRLAGLVSIGSKAVKIKPNKWTKKDPPREWPTTQIFVAGKRKSFRNLPNLVGTIEEGSYEELDLRHIEQISVISAEERIKNLAIENDNRWYEVGLHLLPDEDSSFIQDNFESFASAVGVTVHAQYGFIVGNLWFVPVEGQLQAIKLLTEFAFIRVVRPVPKLRAFRPLQRATGVTLGCSLPTEQPLSSRPRVAILDGGLPNDHLLDNWIGSYTVLDPKADDDPDGIIHGLGVTSAFLFGPISPGVEPPRPFSYVDHLRVLDKEADGEDPLELYRTLGLIEQVLLMRHYEFINLSLGPDLPVEDTDVHAWTSVIDSMLSDGETFMTVAVGNNGEMDKCSGNARVQVPSDCVNAVAVGSANHTEAIWARASYSAIGPGRSPGVIKPDLLAFGGDPCKYFHVLAPGKRPSLSPQLGTSFAAPYLLRSAVGIRAVLGDDLSPLAIKALLVHSANDGGHDKIEVGWGKIPENVMHVITCPPGEARVVYQGELKPGKYLRAPLPVPKEGIPGRVALKATFCYASPVDPQDTCSYTKAGLEVVFRPDLDNIKEGKKNPATKGFFEMKKYSSEDERRSDMGKWETVLHGHARMLGTTLKAPVFDIHYNAREAGGATRTADKIKYALVITIEAPKAPEIYNDILRAYSNILIPIQPEISIPIIV
ncbi:MAG TPA: S8 family peptidase [Geobacteraceae bacterium]